MIRKIIKIDESRCNGCGACAAACHEGAIEIIDGKAVLTREDYCDGLGDCLPECPSGAISFEEREAPAYDEAAVLAAAQKKARESEDSTSHMPAGVSRLGQWPCQIKLAPVNAPYFSGAELLIAADCTAYAYANIHEDFMKGKITLVGCPKLDSVDYSTKLAEIMRYNDIKSVTVLRMEVPCCGGIEMAAKKALQESGKSIPWQTITVSIDGKIM
ncbi:MAG: 4Fe-4S binding protein [Lachnospiraceae bacterium]|nr:4Fe-4S binding protein [Lachnospiraceae bacterium]